MNKREAALQFIRDNSRCLRENTWDRLAMPSWTVEYRAVNGYGFFLLDMGKDGWTCFWPTKENKVDVEMEKFAEISGEKFEWPETFNGRPIKPQTEDNE